MSEELNNRWNISVKTLSMALKSDKDIREGVLDSIRAKVSESYLEILGETGEEPDRPDFADAIFDELYGVDEVGRVESPSAPKKSNGAPPAVMTQEEVESRTRKVKRKKSSPKRRTPKNKKKSPPKRRKPVKKSVKKGKKKPVKRRVAKKKTKAKKRKR